MPDRKGITKLLTDILIREKLTDRKYFAREVTLDYGTEHPKRVDVMQFIPQGVTYASDIEKGIFTSYEVKSCIEDVFSGNGLNFYGEKNYIVTTMETWKKLKDGMEKLDKHLRENFPESSRHYGVLVAVPKEIDPRNVETLYAELENPTPFGGDPAEWTLWTALPCREGRRTRSMNELLFCMLRSKHSATNNTEIVTKAESEGEE